MLLQMREGGFLEPALGDPAPSSPSPAALPGRAGIERAFASDFSDVRAHEGAGAAALGAQAYAQGDAIHFGAGAYDPAAAAGNHLLGHEAAHVVQQRAGLFRGQYD
jgi:hypothetical protein